MRIRRTRTLTPEQRAAAEKGYEETIITASFPKAGWVADQISLRRQDRVIFAAPQNKPQAKEFVKFLLQEENLQPYVEGALRANSR